MGGACNTYGGGGEMDTRFWWEDQLKRDHLEDESVDERIILKRICKK
jgi:hypothetical protein